MALSNVSWKGLKAVEKMADILPNKIAGKRLREAYKYALQPVKDRMIANLPRDKTGNLKHSIGITVSGSDLKEMFGVVGPRKRKFTWNMQGWHAHMIEWGTKKHTITAGPGKMMPIFNKAGFTGKFAKSIEHEGSVGTKPFKRAIDNKQIDVGKRVADKVGEIMALEIKNIWSVYGNVATKDDI